MVAALLAADEAGLAAGPPVPSRAATVVARSAEQIMQAGPDRPPSIAGIAAPAGLGQRRAQQACRTLRGQTPRAVLISLRLEPAPARTPVTAAPSSASRSTAARRMPGASPGPLPNASTTVRRRPFAADRAARAGAGAAPRGRSSPRQLPARPGAMRGDRPPRPPCLSAAARAVTPLRRNGWRPVSRPNEVPRCWRACARVRNPGWPRS